MRNIASDATLWWAVAASIALHILMAYIIPGINFEDLKNSMIMSVELAPPPTASQPQPIEKIEPQLETPPAPPIKKHNPSIKPDVRPVLSPVTSPIAEPAATSALETEAKPQPPTSVTSESKEEAKPAVAAPAQAKPVGPVSQEANDDRNQYGDMLTRHIDKYKQYPRIAQMRNWEGDVLLELQLDANGNLTSSRIYTSSGKESLDNQALEMVKKASPFPVPPASLRGRAFTIMVPIKFRLDN